MAEPHSYTLIRSKRRTIALTISPEATLVVRAPMRTPVGYIEAFIHEKLDWVTRMLAKARARPHAKPKDFREGEQFLYLGKLYPLAITDAGPKMLRFKDGFSLPKLSNAEARMAFTNWYRKAARKIISERVDAYAARFDINVKAIRITGARTRWGSASPRGVNFSWRLVMAPIEVIDYVVAHELAHLRHANHGREFWSEVARIYPSYGEPKRWLRKHGTMLDI